MTETKTFYPGSYEGFSGNTIRNPSNPVGKGSSNTTYADVNAASKGTAYCYWPFDVSAIPENATIDSVSCVAGVMVSSGASPFTGNIQLYSGSTAKGTASSLSYSTSKKIITLSVGTWTRAELNGIRLRTYLKNNGSFAFSLSFYGADLTVQYTYQSEKFMLKLDGSWTDVARVFKKVSGIWVEQTDLANVVDQTKRLVNGGEYVVELPEGYTKLPYLESTGVEYIATNVPAKSTTGFVVDFALVSASGTTGVVGAFNYGGINHNFAAYEGKWYTQWGNNEGGMFGTTDTDRHVVSQNVTPGAVVFDGETLKTGATFYDNAERTFNLFCYNGGPSYPDFWIGSLRMYSAVFYDNGVAVAKFVPCVNDSGVAGMYDTVSNVFYRSASGTDFGASGLITFTITDYSYQAERGMTWGEWVASEYNTPGYVQNNDNRIRVPIAAVFVSTASGQNVTASDVIIAGHAYTHS